jgi:hypothetical protein
MTPIKLPVVVATDPTQSKLKFGSAKPASMVLGKADEPSKVDDDDVSDDFAIDVNDGPVPTPIPVALSPLAAPSRKSSRHKPTNLFQVIMQLEKTEDEHRIVKMKKGTRETDAFDALESDEDE